MDQIEELNPPPSPTKMQDSRASEYEKQFGSECWELDALEPSYITSLIRVNIEQEIDPQVWDAAMEREERQRSILARLAANWETVASQLEGH